MSALYFLSPKTMFTVLNQVSGKSFQCGNEESVLDGAISNGFNFPYGCQNGFCGQCKAVILNGEIDYDGEVPSVLSVDDIDSNMALLCQCKAKSDLYIAVDELDSLAAIEVRSMPCRVEQINRLNHDVIQLILKIPGAQSLQYLAGQYLDLEHSDFEPRSYSIANAPTNSNLIELHIRLVDDGKLTNFIFNSLSVKSILRIEGPKGSFFLREESKCPIIFIAGGTGFGPVKAIIEHLINIGSNRKVYLYWGVRTEIDLYSNLPSEWSEKYPNISFVPVLSEAGESWNGNIGYVHDSVINDFEDLTDFEVYACGPPVMVNAAVKSCFKNKLAKENFFSDSFEYANVSNDNV